MGSLSTSDGVTLAAKNKFRTGKARVRRNAILAGFLGAGGQMGSPLSLTGVVESAGIPKLVGVVNSVAVGIVQSVFAFALRVWLRTPQI